MRSAILLGLIAATAAQAPAPRPRARDLGIKVGILDPGPLNAITDVAGVEVGQYTLVRDPDFHTGITAILPHAGNLFQEKVPGAVDVGNAFGKLMGSTQVEELGEIETPILLTSTLNVPKVADGLIGYMLQLPGNERVESINPVVGETNDGTLNDIRSRPLGESEVFEAIDHARGGPVEEGAVGAGAGTIAFGFKGGIGTSSRKLPARSGGYTVGVLVQTNFGGVLTIDGAPVGVKLGRYYMQNQVGPAAGRGGGGGGAGRDYDPQSPDGSCMIVVATDAPIGSRNLKRLAARALLGLGRTGSAASNGSGDFVIAFSTAPDLRRIAGRGLLLPPAAELTNDAMSPLFLAAIEATEEAIYNSLFKATTTTGRGRTIEALPIDQTVEILREYGVIPK